MKRLIIYGSQYGTAKCYAKKLSELTGIPVMDYKEIGDLSGYEEILHIGGLYAGGVKGLKRTVKALPQQAGLIIITVGLADVTNPENTDHIKKSVWGQVPRSVSDRTKIYHLRGAIDYGNLSFAHKAMMSLVYQKGKNLPEEQKTAEVRDMIETYGQKVNFVDFNALHEITDAIKQNEKGQH